MSSDRTWKKLDRETIFVPHIIFDNYVRRRLVTHLNSFAEHNWGIDQPIDFLHWRRLVNDWLLGKAYYVEGLEKPFPDTVHEKFFDQAFPTGELEDLFNRTTYSRNTLLLHVLVQFLHETPYLEFSINHLYQSDHEMRAAFNFLDFAKVRRAANPDDLSGTYTAVTDITSWSRYPVDRHFREDPTIRYHEDFSRNTGYDDKEPELENRRVLGSLWLEKTKDGGVYRANFREYRNGSKAGLYSGYLAQTEYEYVADVVDRNGRLIRMSLGFLKTKSGSFVFEGGFHNCGISGKTTITQDINIVPWNIDGGDV